MRMAGTELKGFCVLFKLETSLLVLAIASTLFGNAVCQPAVLGQPGYSVDTSYSQPAHRGHSMLVTVNVTNLAYYIAASVENLVLTLDWGATFAELTPRPLDPGKTDTWQFSVDIPSYTWSGAHVCVIDIMVAFSYPAWRMETIITHVPIDVHGEISLHFSVQSMSLSGPSATVVGPGLIKVMPSTRASSNQQNTSPFSLVYRGIIIAVIFIAVTILLKRPPLRNPLARHGGAS